ncbi:MAG: glycosyltransferase family 2 protein [Candidatus Roizmanbacteria bacterium]|nr:MAG: glycosyltransferase family 2 protein [Candidatus Roizmanbacteria bacterium]
MKTNYPLVSIGVPTYNRAYGFEETLDCLIKQTYKNIEIIISNDASVDDTYKICKAYAKKDKRIKIFQQKKNLGLPKNHNFVLSKAKGEYFMWAGDDDPRSKMMIKALANSLIKHKEAVLAVCNYVEFKGNKRKIINLDYKSYLKSYNAITTYLLKPDLLFWGLYKTEVLKQIKGFHMDNRPFLKWGSDNLTVFKILLRGDLIYVDKPLLYKRDSGNATDRFTVLENLQFSEEIIKRIKRYLIFPVMFFFDFFFMVKYTSESKLPLVKKVTIIGCALYWWLRTTLNFLKEVIKGFYFVVKGLLQKLVNNFLDLTKLFRSS